MKDEKKLWSSWNYAGVLPLFGLTLVVPLIIFKTLRALFYSRRYDVLVGKVVVITGASSGLGEAFAKEFYKRGCLVVLCARRRSELDRVRSELLQMHIDGPTHTPIIMPLDLNDQETHIAQVNKILAVTNHIDILINNGGISNRGSILETDLQVFSAVLNVNFLGTVSYTKAVLKGMTERNSGHIVFISSIQGLIAIPFRAAYSCSKHALQAFGDSLRAEVAKSNIKVLTVSPGYVRTEISLNALTGSGERHAKLDATTEQGYSTEYVAKVVLAAVIQHKKEIVISTVLPRIAIFLRHFFPSLFFSAMERRAKKLDN